MSLPPLAYTETAGNATRNKLNKTQDAMQKMRSFNFSDYYGDWDIAEEKNLSSDRYPYITQRMNRAVVPGHSNVSAMTIWNGHIITAEGTSIKWDGDTICSCTSGEKQWAYVNTKLVVWPDKFYIDLNDKSVTPLAASETSSYTFGTNTVTDNSVSTIDYVNVGDAIEVSGSTSNNVTFVVASIEGNVITATTDDIFTAETATCTLSRNIPDMDFICEHNNRLWGCSSENETIYASALGDPTNFYLYQGVSTDSYAVAVGSDSKFTGCCALSSSILFWKEHKLHKLLGDYPAEYALYTYELEGLKEGCHKSLVVVNEVLYYMGVHGICYYSGGASSSISRNFGNLSFSNAVAGTNGEKYYCSAHDVMWHLFVFDTVKNIWCEEDDVHAVDFSRDGNDMYFAAGGNVYKNSSGFFNGEWKCRFKPFYDTIKGRKRLHKILVRAEVPRGSTLTVKASVNGGEFLPVMRAVECMGVVRMRVNVNRCDKYELQLEGHGPCTILEIEREFSVMSEV